MFTPQISDNAHNTEKLLSDLNEQPRLIDEASATVTYIGWSATGTLISAAAWQIMRVTVTGTVTAIEYAVARGNKTNVWNDRATLIYV